MLSRFRGHAAEGIILLALGDLNEGLPTTAIKYYEAATRCPVQSDLLGFAQQSAWRRLSEVHEKNKAYREAVNALQNWRISGSCGVGVSGSRIWRAFKIWELRLHYLPQDRVFNDLWEDLESERITFGEGASIDGLAQRVRILYGQAELLIARLTSFSAERSVTALIASDSKRHDCCILFALGKIGGEDVVQYLISKAKQEGNMWYLRDYHFCLLLTGDKAARVFVMAAAAEGEGNNRHCAVWALENSPVLSEEPKDIEEGADGSVVNCSP